MKKYTLLLTLALSGCVSSIMEGDLRPIPDLKTVPCRAEMEASRGWHGVDESPSRLNDKNDLERTVRDINARREAMEERIQSF